MPLPDAAITAARKQAIRNRGKMVTYQKYASETTNLKTGTTTPTFTDHELRALVSGVALTADGTRRTFRFLKSELPEYPPSRRSVVESEDETYNIVGWSTSQHEDVVDVIGAAP